MNAVSIILPTYNRAGCFRVAVESVLSQSYQQIELIIIDDGSTDGTRDLVTPYLRDQRVRYVHQDNFGAAAARNMGLSLKKYDLVAFIDSDDVWEPEKLRIQVAVLDALPEVGIVFSNFSASKGGRLIESSHIRSFFSVFDEYCLAYEDVFVHRLQHAIEGLKGEETVHWGDIYTTMLFGNIILTSTCLCRSEVFNRVGMFDCCYETLEDYDLFLRITKAFLAAFIVKPLVRYHYSENQLSGEAFYCKLCVNLINIFKKNVKGINDQGFLKRNRHKIRRRLGAYEAQLGYYHFAHNNKWKAVRCYLKSIMQDPRNYRRYVYLFFSAIPQQVVGLARTMKKLFTIPIR